MTGEKTSASAASIKDLDSAEFSRFSALLDESLDLAPEARSEWLSRVERTDPKLAPLLAGFFTSRDACNAGGFLSGASPLPGGIAAAAPDTLLVGRLFGPYRVLSLLGHGGMGSVWLAERMDGLFTRQVALKLVHPALMGRAISERFTREREILASLNHPNIARLFDAGFSDDGQPYLALEYIPGKPVTQYCDDRGLSIPERLQIFRQVLAAVQYAHAHLVIHRDLKPSNILVTEEGHAQLLDFGIAKLMSEGEAKETELTRLGGRALTPDYAAPEQILGGPITISADIYSLGVMLYELLTGERPYRLKRDSRGALEEAIVQADPGLPSRTDISEPVAAARSTTPKKLPRALRGDLDTIALKALKKLPAERYATAYAFSEDIDRYLSGDVVLAQKDSLAYRIRKFARRYRVAIAAGSILILTLAAGLAATTYEASVASAQRDQALESDSRLLTQAAAASVKDGDAPRGMGIILEVLPHRGAGRPYTPESLSAFQEARASDSQLMAITGHSARVRSIQFSPDGTQLITAAFDNTARVWDAQTGQQQLVIEGHQAAVVSAYYSPNGRLILTASSDKTARVWDAATGRQLLTLDHPDRVRSAMFSADGIHIVTASYDKIARIWDAASGRQTATLAGHAELVTFASFSPDGRRVVTSSNDKTARIWDAATGHPITELRGHTDRVITAYYSPDGTRILTGSGDKTARIWDAVTGQQIQVMRGNTQLIACAAFSPDGRRVVTAAYDNSTRVFDAATGQQISLLSGHTEAVEWAAFSPDGRRIATASLDRTARVWNAGSAGELQQFVGHTDMLPYAAFSTDGRRVVSASFDQTVRVWDVASGRQLLLLPHRDRVTKATFSPDGTRIASSSIDRLGRIWDAETGRELTQLSGHADGVFWIAFSPDGRRVATTSIDKSVRIWDVATGREQMKLLGHAGPVGAVAFSPDGSRIITTSEDQTARVWDLAIGKEIMLLSAHTDAVEDATFSPDGRRLATASDDGTARIWDADTGREIMLLRGHKDQVTAIRFSPDQSRFVTASDDRTARIWDAATGQELLVLKHPNFVESAMFSPDGRRVLTASDDGIARIWDASTQPIDVQIRWAEAAQFDPLLKVDRFQLGLRPPAGMIQWPKNSSKCDEAAAAPYDPERRAAGAMLDQIAPDLAIPACAPEKGNANDAARLRYQSGRAQMANGNLAAARRELAEAIARGYRAAWVDLGTLLSDPAYNAVDLAQAKSSYERAWNEGVTAGAFQLGSLYERAADEARAWQWFQKAADAGQPDALVRFALRAEAAAYSTADPAQRNTRLLEAFKYYAAAVARARNEDWPDATWRNWRYRRASLARLLAREGLMQEVADVYDAVRIQYTAATPGAWHRLAAVFRSKQ
jgi:WD40 repeat protein/serine/threonine protein kinase